MACQNPARQGISRATPEALFLRRKVPIVFVKEALEAERNRFAERVLPHDVGVSLAVSRSSLLPLLRNVRQLILPGRYGALCVPHRVDEGSAKQAVSLRLCYRSELARFRGLH